MAGYVTGSRRLKKKHSESGKANIDEYIQEQDSKYNKFQYSPRSDNPISK